MQTPTGQIQIELPKGYTTTLDAVDVDLAYYKWYAKKMGRIGTKRVYVYGNQWSDSKEIPLGQMHRIILSRMLGRPLKAKEFVDHIDGNPLNNCRSNLRLVSTAENTQNTKRRKDNKSGFKGVIRKQWSDNGGAWRAHIRVNGKEIHLGYFDTPEKAHAAYCEAAKKYFGEFARFE